MEITFTIDEAKILELAKVTSIDELPRSIYWEAKKQAVDIAVKEIKDKLVEKSYYNGKEALYSEIKDYLYKQIENTITETIKNKFNEKSIQSMIDRITEKTLQFWIEKKIYERLNAIKADINFYSETNLQEEQKLREDEMNNE